MDTTPDYKEPETPEGFVRVGYKVPKKGDYMIDFYGEPFLVREDGLYFEQWLCFRKKSDETNKLDKTSL